jgi:hypothetical protein
VNTGLVSAKRPSVTSMTSRFASGSVPAASATRAIRIRPSGLSSGWDQASQAESGDQLNPVTGPSPDAASSLTCPDVTSTSSSLPSCAAAATIAPSGEAASCVT